MAHFRGTVAGNRSVASRLGTKNSGMLVTAAGWQGRITVQLTEIDGVDYYDIVLGPHMGSGGKARIIAAGKLDAPALADDPAALEDRLCGIVPNRGES